MVNVNSSLESSVAQLARSGNARALTFWLNRLLVPQGFCAQVVAEPSKELLIRVMCHRPPDSDQLVQFIVKQLRELNSAAIQEIRIATQMVGTTNSLWERSLRLPAMHHSVHHLEQPPASPASSPRSRVASPESQVYPLPNLHVVPAVAPSATAVAFPADPQGSQAPPSPEPPPAPAASGRPPLHLVPPEAGRRPARPAPRKQRPWAHVLVRKTLKLKADAAQSIYRSVEWVLSRSMPVRVLILGGSAVSAFLLGCGVELLNQSTTASTPRSSHQSGISFFHVKPPRSSTVRTAVGEVNVIQPTVQQPEQPEVTLMFSSSGALGKGYIGKGMEDYYDADLVMTSLDKPLASATAIASRPASGSYDQAFLDGTPNADSQAADSQDAETAEDSSRSQRADATMLQALRAGSVDIVDLTGAMKVAKGDSAETLTQLNQNAIYSLGADADPQAARRPQIFDVKGQRIAYFSYADPSLVESLTKVAGLGESNSISQMAEDIKAVRDQVDWIVVSYHWSRSLRAYPEDWQVKLTHTAVDLGADLVVGYQPGITQGAEIYKGRAIAYSLGNDIDEYDDAGSGGTYDTVALKVNLEDKKMKLEFLPIQVRQGEPVVASGNAADEILRTLHQASSLFDQPMRSPSTLDAEMRLTLPSAPDATMPTEPFLSYPHEKSN